MDRERAESGLGGVEREAAAEKTASPPSDTPVGSVRGKVAPRQWVMIAGGVMALGWLGLLISLLIGSGAVATYALVVMIPLSIWWNRKTRAPVTKNQPQVAPEAKSSRVTKGAALKWGGRAAVSVVKKNLGKDAVPKLHETDEESAVTTMLWGERGSRRRERPLMPSFGDAIRGGRRLKPMRRAIFRTTFTVIKGFFTPVIAAVAEWRSAQ